MAARFWVGGTGNWNDTAHWSTISGGGGGSAAPTSADDVTFDANSGAAATVTINAPAGQCLTLTINKSDLTLIDTVGLTVTNGVTLTTGTFNTNGQTESWGTFTSTGVLARTLTLGASAITITGTATTVWSTTNSLTMTANTATITSNGATATWSHSGSMNGASLVMTGSGVATIQSGPTFANFTRTGTAAKSDALTLASSFIVTGTVTLGGNTVQGVNRLIVQLSIPGTSATVKITTPAVVITGDVDFTDSIILTAGLGTPTWTNGSSAFVGDGGANGATVTANATVSAAQAWQTTGSGAWSDPTKWTSRVPLPQDAVTVAQAFVGSVTLTSDMPRLGASIDFTGSTGTLAWNPASLTGGASIFGSLTLRAGMTIVTNFNALICAGRGVNTITTASVNLQSHSLQVTCGGGSYTLQDDFSSVGAVNVTNGSLSTNGRTLSIFQLQSATSGQTRTLDVRNSTISITNTANGATPINLTASALTFLADNSVLDITDATAGAAKTIQGANQHYGTVRYSNAGTGSLNITGFNTFDVLDIEVNQANRTLTLPAGNGVTTVLRALNLNGNNGGLLTVVSSTPGTAVTVNAPCPAVTRLNGSSLSGDINISQCPQVVQPAHALSFFS